MRNWDWLRLSNKLKPVRGKIYISETERRKCRRVAAVFSDMYEHENLLVLDAGRYGFVKLNDFRESFGFCEVYTFTESKELFEDLWKEWVNSQLIFLTSESQLAELDYDDMLEALPPSVMKRVNRKKHQLMVRAGLIPGKEMYPSAARHWGR